MSSWERKEAVAILGSAVRFTEDQVMAGFRVGLELGRLGRNVVTGATLGVPYAAAIGAKQGGATVVGLSPAGDEAEHIERYRMPVDYLDIIVYTGMGREGRNPLNVRSAQGAIFIGGEFGTLGEFSAAWTLGGKVLGVLEGMGGISDHIRQLASRVSSDYGSLVVFETSPETLARRVCEAMDARQSLRGSDDSVTRIGADVRSIVEGYLGRAAAVEK